MRYLKILEEKISVLGFGCMGMSEFYGNCCDDDAIICHAVDRGVNLFDTADVYGMGHNESLVGRALKSVDSEVMIASKGGLLRNEKGGWIGVDGAPSYIKKACEDSLKRLGIEVIDFYFLHRVDPKVPIEDSMSAFAELITEGKIRYAGLSEASVSTLKKAQKIVPVSAIQNEYSLWSRDPEKEHLKFCRENGALFMASAPLGRGFLTAKFPEKNELEKDDIRSYLPRFKEPNLSFNLKLVKLFAQIAEQKECTPGQLALCWLIGNTENVVPIPGTRSIARLDENLQSSDLYLSEAERFEIEAVFSDVSGDRLDLIGMKSVNL